MTKIQFKFTDKFDRYVIIEYDLNLNEYINYSCQDNGNIGYQGDIIYIRCTAEKRLDSYAEREFNFVDCSNNNNYQLINTSSESSFEFYLTTPIITEDAPLKIYIKCVHNQNINQISVVKNEISPPLVIDFEMVEITEDSATVRVTASKDLSNNYDYTEYGIGTQDTAQFHQFYDTDSYLTKDFNINEQ
ncbi:hypothetical protein TVAG_266750 [Trichomonas vaginalis G3]|uniref:Uncharacterized protein n=1 Tax=Trichomonas vaginalis (strain ATCC PRA-98 / G3) TaxID=412133 RepID=A2DQM8_TRIV3|nr:hypothetical protein TVAGG3_0480550 [Trichomonas vaginalis G3]EAY17312.1 hypothetical protein TVAG_266750 [Trichomonas vaginalis G3]KAI5515676.1 hypothetical protein TVAGG3_0480550 [Trichomonas vaginalis G3]|eukprot:XP_001329535.1 hypothetical protein [Trichomonas vaginalis G3]